MDKVINGVDVSGCEFYFEDNGVIAPDGTPEQANICSSAEKSCENSDSCYCNKDCYYKQLKRLEAEYDDLHLSYAGCKTANNGLQELNKNLEEENKILNNMLKVNDSTKYDYYKFIKENEQLHNDLKECGIKREQYRQALQEIREMIDCANCEYESNDNCNPQQCSKIETKINQVIGAE